MERIGRLGRNGRVGRKERESMTHARRLPWNKDERREGF